MTKPILAAVLLALAMPAWAQAPSPAPAPAPAPDGVSFDQWAQRARERLMALDTNHDGKISQEEFAARAAMMGRGAMHGSAPAPGDVKGDAPAPARDRSRMFARLDANSDGVLDTPEINAMLARRFARMDANHDGALTPDERQAMRGPEAPEQ